MLSVIIRLLRKLQKLCEYELYLLYNELKKINSGSDSLYFESVEKDSRYLNKGRKKTKNKLTTYTIRLKEGIRATDGMAVTADDLMFNYYLRTD